MISSHGGDCSARTLVEHRDADAEAHPPLPHAGDCAQLVLQLVDYEQGFGAAGLGQNHREFVTSDAADGVAPAQGIDGDFGNRLQDLVALGVSVIVVDLLEIVAVDVGEAERSPPAFVPCDFIGQRFLEALAISRPGQCVDARGKSLLVVELA